MLLLLCLKKNKYSRTRRKRKYIYRYNVMVRRASQTLPIIILEKSSSISTNVCKTFSAETSVKTISSPPHTMMRPFLTITIIITQTTNSASQIFLSYIGKRQASRQMCVAFSAETSAKSANIFFITPARNKYNSCY